MQGTPPGRLPRKPAYRNGIRPEAASSRLFHHNTVFLGMKVVVATDSERTYGNDITVVKHDRITGRVHSVL